MNRLTAALALAGTVAGLVAGATSTATADPRPTMPGPGTSFSCRLAWNATTYAAEHAGEALPGMAELRRMADRATRDCEAGK